MATDLKKWGRFSAILEDPRMRSSRKVVIGVEMDRQDNDSDRGRIVITSQKQRQSRKNEPKMVDLGIWHWHYFFNIVQSIQFIYTSLVPIYNFLSNDSVNNIIQRIHINVKNALS